MDKILVTGGEGFIGTNLALELEKRGFDVITCDIKHLDKVNYSRCDVGNYRHLTKLFSIHPDITHVYHLAAEYGRWNGEDYYEDLWRTNVIGTKNVIRFQEKMKFKLIFFSSAEVYGDFQGEMSESIMQTNPISDTYQMNDYAISKWAGELMVMNSERVNDTETVRVRPVNCYGPYEVYHNYRGFIPKFIYKILHNEKITVYSGHKRIIDYVEDSCRTWANIIDNFKANSVYNVGGKLEWEHDIEWYATKILEIIGKSQDLIEVRESELNTTAKKTMNFDKARKELNHNPIVPPEEGLRRTIEWMKKYYKIE